MKWVFKPRPKSNISTFFKQQDWQMFGLKLNKYVINNSVEVVGRCSETQLQVGENLEDLF